MAQLIKINQCVSRYQVDLRCYANRFTWLKKKRMEEWKERWENRLDIKNRAQQDDKYSKPLKIEFGNWMFEKQLDWSTRTAFEWSIRPDKIHTEQWLRRILEGINDVSFFMYQPVLLTKSGPVQLDSVLITNDIICCVHPLKGEPGNVFRNVTQRKWCEMTNGVMRPLISPLISLRRTKAVVSAFLKSHDLASMKIEAAVYAPECYIEQTMSNYEADFIDRRNERDWFIRLDQHSLLMKREQLEAAELLLKHSETIADPRNADQNAF